MTLELAVLGVPTSAGAHHAGQDLTPGAVLRVRDIGDVAGSVWMQDRPDAAARSLDAVTQVAGALLERYVELVVDVVGGAALLRSDPAPRPLT
jgi:arginase